MHFLGLFTLHYTYVMLHIFTALFCCREQPGREGGGREAGRERLVRQSPDPALPGVL